MSGYVRAQRDRFEHPLFKATKKSPFCRGYAWDWMIAKAVWKATTYDVRGKTVTVGRGQFIASPEELAEAWEWSRSAALRFLNRLVTEHMIEQSTEHGKTLITICNYDLYQSDAERSGHMSGQPSGQEPDTNRTQSEQQKKKVIREEEKREARASLPRCSRFDEFWQTYPHRNGTKKGRASALKSYTNRVKDGVSEQTLIDGAHAAHQHPDVIRGYARDPTTWLNAEGWTDEIGQIVPIRQERTDVQPSRASRSDQRLDAFLRGASG